MIWLMAVLALAVTAVPATAQFRDTIVAQDRTDRAAGVVLRSLDKTTGQVRDISLTQGDTEEVGRLQVTLGECRYPVENPSGNAYAYLVIRDAGVAEPRFAGWMVASSPALNALEDRRYDVWVMRCTS